MKERRERRVQSPWKPVFRGAVAIYFAGVAGAVGWKVHPVAGVLIGLVVLALLLKVAFKPTYY
jgi:hypothetical protein